MVIGMSAGAVAGLIASGAFVVLVIYLCIVLTHVSAILKVMAQHADQVGQDVDSLSREVESLVVSTNELVDDLNRKAEQVTPAVEAIAKLGQSVSDLNDASRDLVTKTTTATQKSPLNHRLVKLALQTVLASVWRRKQRRTRKGATHE